MNTPMEWVLVPNGWVYQTEGGFYRNYSKGGVGAGPRVNPLSRILK